MVYLVILLFGLALFFLEICGLTYVNPNLQFTVSMSALVNWMGLVKSFTSQKLIAYQVVMEGGEIFLKSVAVALF